MPDDHPQPASDRGFIVPTGAETVNGKGLGVATDLTFTAAGELDNGHTVNYMMAVDTDGALSNTSSQLTYGMGSMGTLQLNNKGGSKANGIDDITPNATMKLGMV